MSELTFPGNIIDLGKINKNELLTPSLQEKVESQFGFIPEFHRRYDETMQCRVTVYEPNEGYVRFQSAGNNRDDLVAWRHFPVYGSVTEYQLINPKTKDRASRWAFFTKDWEGKIALSDAGIYFKQGLLDTDYRISYEEDHLNCASVQIFYNQSRDTRVFFPYTELVHACRFEGKPWEILVAHGNFKQLEAYYFEQRRQYQLPDHLIKAPDLRFRFPGVHLKFPEIETDVLVFDGVQSSPDVHKEAKQIDLLELGKPKIISERGRYLYLVTTDKVAYIGRAGQDRKDKSVWEITLFNDDIKTLDQAIKGDWIHIKDDLRVELVTN